MKIKLYKKCVLNNAYKNVFSFGKTYDGASTLIEDYLNSLDCFPQNNYLNIDYVYQENSGTLTFELNNINSYGNIYEYNYMKIISDDTLITRYCFIDRIRLKNDVVYLDYSEDGWHSYGSSMKITKSFLTNNRLANEVHFHITDLKTLPLEYENNDNITIIKTENNTIFNIIVEAQIYDTKSGGEINNRITKVFMIERYNATISGHNFPLDEAQIIAQNLITVQSSRCVGKFGSLSQDLYININEIYIVPLGFNLVEHFDINNFSSDGYTIVGTNAFWQSSTISCHLFPPILADNNKLNHLLAYEIQNNFKIKSIGTFNNQIEVKNNGYSHKVHLYTFTTENDFKLFMSFNNQMIEITSDFKYDCPFEAVNGEKNSLLRLNRHLENIRSIIGIATSIGLGASVSKVPLGMLENTSTRALTVPSYVDMGGLYVEGVPMARSMKYKNEVNVSGNAPSSNDILGLIRNNAPFYSSTSSKNVQMNGVEGAYYGICYFVNIAPTNETLVENAINENGYNVYELISNLDITGITGNNIGNIDSTMEELEYNFVKFGYINVYGNFPRNICNLLERILLNGTKVWFTKNVV